MHKKTHNTQPSKPPATARPGDTFEMDAGDTTPGDMALGVLQGEMKALAIYDLSGRFTATRREKCFGQIRDVLPCPGSTGTIQLIFCQDFTPLRNSRRRNSTEPGRRSSRPTQ